ncbi:hypothetical protein MKW92_029328 [Papaver armeniacum]|nr:hypothetical protein MKW92_029328 [Papaver armeniacum]
MDSVASATRDLSQLSVSKNPTPSRKFEPIDFSELQYGSVSFTTSRTKWGGFGGNVAAHKHVIGIDGNKFTVDGGPERDADDPENAKFLECIKNYEIPEEFAEDGVHTILIVRTCAAYKKKLLALRHKSIYDYWL